MYSTYYPIGTSGHRATGSYGFVPYTSYATPIYGLPLPPPQYAQPPAYPLVAPTQTQAQPQHAGGITAVLEYEPASMAQFICWCSFGMLGQSRSASKELEASVVAILHATRLPKATIVIALEYINQRYSASTCAGVPESDVFLKIVVALVLANKFNDDNTFTNKSWCGASGVDISVLNSMEKEWLAAVNWNLSVVAFRDNIETLEECWASWVQKHASPYFSSPVVDNYGPFSAPSSPAYESTAASSAYGYSSPISASPAKFSQDWSVPQNLHFSGPPYPYQQPSIWAYQPGYPAPRMDSAYSACHGFANPYYNCLASY